MKKTSTSTPLYLFVLLTAVAFIGFIGCGPPTGTPPGANNGNTALNNNANLSPTTSPTPSPTPPCDDKFVDQKLLEAWRAPGNAPAFAQIRRTVNFYSRNCTIYLWGYTRNLGTFKKLEQMARETPNTLRALNINDDNLYIVASEYPPGGPPCATGYKRCNDICIPESDTCLTEIVLSTPPPGSGNQNSP